MAERRHVTQASTVLPAWTADDQERHRKRAIQAIAEHRCSCDLTTGFCGPRDGKCTRPTAESRPDRNCIVQATALVEAMATNGVVPIWVYDKIFKDGGAP